jgi:hypothetical protein
MRILWPATSVLLFMALAYNSFEDRVGGYALAQDGTQPNSIDGRSAGSRALLLEGRGAVECARSREKSVTRAS